MVNISIFRDNEYDPESQYFQFDKGTNTVNHVSLGFLEKIFHNKHVSNCRVVDAVLGSDDKTGKYQVNLKAIESELERAGIITKFFCKIIYGVDIDETIEKIQASNNSQRGGARDAETQGKKVIVSPRLSISSASAFKIAINHLMLNLGLMCLVNQIKKLKEKNTKLEEEVLGLYAEIKSSPLEVEYEELGQSMGLFQQFQETLG
ncbi:hypothetical protein N9Y92_03385 [Chlamydiales bacterium]|nr:hypothetical protein [Chlamydiales bacterium]